MACSLMSNWTRYVVESERISGEKAKSDAFLMFPLTGRLSPVSYAFDGGWYCILLDEAP